MRANEEKVVDCVIWKQGKTQLGTTTITLERAETTVVFKNVPAQVCENCGEAYVEEEECPATGLGHERKYLVRAMRAPACPKCAEQAPDNGYRVDMDELNMLPGLALNKWKLELKSRGLI